MISDMDSMDDAALFQLLSQSNEAAFAEIYNRYWDKLFAVAANKLDKDLPLAEELVQDMFMDLWRRRETLEIAGSPSIYLASAMKYKIIDARIKRKRIRDQQKNLLLQTSDIDMATEQQLSFDELKNRLAKLVQKLPEKCKLVYVMSKEDGYSQKEIAKQLQISEKTVESHLSRAMKSLRSGLKMLSMLIYQVKQTM